MVEYKGQLAVLICVFRLLLMVIVSAYNLLSMQQPR